ncbi:unnamed protein product [Phytomonas sp. Hart1]|nr:unnamed protein product [Phytomonas sp. Hart1]|eukprot:CCW71171.1 unnamed protein product [Phytomonas sp. isolate Hart1]
MQRSSFFGIFLGVLLVLLFCVTEGRCIEASNMNLKRAYQPSWELIGGGFHMQLALNFPIWAETVRVSITMDNTFFFDTEEIRHHYIVTGENVLDGAKANQRKEPIDLAHDYTPMRVELKEEFDIEAPSFNLPYQTATVSLNLERLATEESTPSNFLEEGKLILPIHARYPYVIRSSDVRDKDFSINVLFHGREDAFQKTCLHDLKVSWTSNKFGDGESSNKRPLCHRIPTTVLEDLPIVYYSLIILLWLGASQVFACLYIRC